MIGRWLARQDDAALERLVGAKFNTTGVLIRDDSACLVGHVRGYDETGTCLYPKWDDLDMGFQFDNLCERFGVERVGTAISERARRVLEERRRQERTSTDSDRGKAASGLDRGAPASVPVSVHVSLNCEPVEVGA